MDQQQLFKPIPCDKFDLLTKDEMATLLKGDQKIIEAQQKEIKRLQDLYLQSEQKSFFVEEKFILIRNKMFGRSSEKSDKAPKEPKAKKPPKKRVLLPSQRYPNATIIEKDVVLDKLPMCKCCNEEMEDSGMLETSEYLTTIPRQFFVVIQNKHKYRCKCCHGDIVTAPAIPRITPGGGLSDEMTIDVSLSKFCDLIPIDRYVKMAERSGLEGLPSNSLIQATHNLADFVRPAYDMSKDEVTSSKVLRADETKHRMLEGGDKKSHYLWGFSTESACYFEIQNTRSGSVATNILKDSKCEFLLSDVFSGYAKAVKQVNEYRKEKHEVLIKNVYCNAHARRKFKEAEDGFPDESPFFVKCYKKIYKLEKYLKKLKDHNPPMTLEEIRMWQKLYFRVLERKAIAMRNSYSSKGSLGKAMNYFLKNYYELTMFLKYNIIPIDNNSQESLFRSPVVGRKTWYGTHSKRGAKTTAILFTLVESCKLNKVNPRKYFPDLVKAIHEGKPAFTPAKYAEEQKVPK